MSSNNPYQAPLAPVTDYVAPDAQGTFLATPKACEAGAGARWLSEGWSIFAQNPGVWIGITVLWFLFAMATALVPVIGSIAGNLMFPVLIGGLMLGCDALRRGEPLTVAHLFAGFNANAAQLILIGALYLAGTIAIVILVFVPVIGFAGLAIFSGTGSPEQMEKLLIPLLLCFLVMMALIVPLAMAVWFAPALVVFNNLSAIDAMKLSFQACMKNFVPYLIWGLIGIAISIAATLTLMLGWLVAVPVFMASAYASYREIFYAD